MTHSMVMTAENAVEVLMECGKCGRKVVVGKGIPKLVVLEKGDFFSEHSGASSGMSAPTLEVN